MSEQTLLPSKLQPGMYLKKLKDFVRYISPYEAISGGGPAVHVCIARGESHLFGVNEELEVEIDAEAVIEGNISKLPVTGLWTMPTLGADPEFFVTMPKGRLLPAFLFLPSKPATPMHAVPFWDGFQAEFVFKGAPICAEEFVKWLRGGRRHLLTAAKALASQPRISDDAVVEVPHKMLESALPEHVAFGCIPSKNAYRAKGQRILDPRQVPIRFAGGHLHFGWPNGRPTAPREATIAYIKALDRTVGLLSVVLSPSPLEAVRRKYYGLAGEYRNTSYGFEYRTLSNFWLRAAPLAHLILDTARFGLALGVMSWTSLLKISDAEVQEAINTNNVPMAQALLSRALGLWENWYVARYTAKLGQFTKLLDNGLKDFAPFLSGTEAHRWPATTTKCQWRGLVMQL